MVNRVYRIGSLVSDTRTGIRGGQAFALATDRTALTDWTETAFVVTALKTFYITEIAVGGYGASSYNVTLMYDDDGAGTNEKNLAVIRISLYGMIVLPSYIAVPAGKHLTAKASTTTVTCIAVAGIEV